jgi:hypothetical protein
MDFRSKFQDPRSRWFRVVANLALVAGLLLWNFASKTSRASHIWIDAGTGLLMGLSIGMNLMLVLRMRRCRSATGL